LFEQVRARPRLEHEACWRVERARDDDFPIGLALHGRAVHARPTPFSPEIAAHALGGRSALLERPAVSAGSGLQRTMISRAVTAAAVPEG